MHDLESVEDPEKQLPWLQAHVVRGQQQDAQELLSYILETIAETTRDDAQSYNPFNFKLVSNIEVKGTGYSNQTQEDASVLSVALNHVKAKILLKLHTCING